MRSRFVAVLAALTVTVGVSGALEGVSGAEESDTSTLKFERFLQQADFSFGSSPVAPREGIGVDSELGLAVATDGSGHVWTIDMTTLKAADHTTVLDGLASHGVLDPARHAAYIGEVLNCDLASPQACDTGVLSGVAPVPAPSIRPRIATVRLTKGLPATEYTLPESATGASVVAMAPFALAGHNLLYVLVSHPYDAPTAASKGFVHQTFLYELDADKLLAGADDALVWSHDVSTCAAFAGAPNDYLGIDPAGRFAYFDCRGIIAANSAAFSPSGAVVIDFPQPLPTAAQEQAGEFRTSFYPAGAPPGQMVSTGDAPAALLIQAAVDGNHNKLYVFDAAHRAWVGSVPAKPVGANLWGIAVDPTNGEAYTFGDNDVIAASQVTTLPVRLGDTPSLGGIVAQGGSGPPLFDPVTGKLILFGGTWVRSDDRSHVPGQNVAAVFRDLSRFTPVDQTPANPDEFTHDVPITADTPVTYSAIASGYGLRTVQVGGVSATQASNAPAVDVSNPANTIDGDCRYLNLPCAGLVPSMYDGSRAITFAKTEVSTQNSGATGDATPYQLDGSTEQEFTSLSSAGTLLGGPANLVGQPPPSLPPNPDPPAQVSQQVEPATCKDFSDKQQDNIQPAARAQCDNQARHAAAVALAPGASPTSPVQVGYATSRVEEASQSAAGAVANVTSEAHGIRVSVPGGPTLSIGSVVTHASSVAVGHAKSAVATFSRTISEATLTDASGRPIYSCGFQSSPSCDPRQLTEEFNKQSPSPVEFLTPEPDGFYGRKVSESGMETLNGSPGGAQAEVIKSVYDYFNDQNVNGDASFEVPGLQIVMVNDGQQPSRLVFSLAAVHAESHQSIDMPPPAPAELADPSLQLTLLDGSTPPKTLSGATFTLQGPDDAKPLTCLTAADGIGTCTFAKLPPGAYTIVETTPPPGFAPADDYELTLEAGTDYKTSFVNLPAIGSVEVTLLEPGAAAKPLPGGVFALHKGSSVLDAPLGTCTTGAGGTCTFDEVPLGDYTMEQVSAPGTFIVSEPVEFDLTKPGQVAKLRFVDGIPGKEAEPPVVIPGKPAIPPTVIPGKPAVPPKVIPGKPAVPPRTMVLPALDGGTGDAALEPAGYDEELSGPAPIVASQPAGALDALSLGSGGLKAVSARLAKLVIHSPQQAVLLLFVWLVLGLPVYLWVRRQQFITATEGI
jgi:hypothetical protein